VCWHGTFNTRIFRIIRHIFLFRSFWLSHLTAFVQICGAVLILQLGVLTYPCLNKQSL